MVVVVITTATTTATTTTSTFWMARKDWWGGYPHRYPHIPLTSHEDKEWVKMEGDWKARSVVIGWWEELQSEEASGKPWPGARPNQCRCAGKRTDGYTGNERGFTGEWRQVMKDCDTHVLLPDTVEDQTFLNHRHHHLNRHHHHLRHHHYHQKSRYHLIPLYFLLLSVTQL